MATASHTDLPPPPPLDAGWALFLDVDGSLLEFAPRPEGVVVPATLRDSLQALQRRLDDAIALVSGRALAQLDRLFAPLRLHAAGLHGLERRGQAALPPPPALAEVRAVAQAAAASQPGALVEDKGPAIAMHWRGVADAAAAEAAFAAVGAAALERLPHYRLQPGDHVLELRPDGADKGAAIAAMLDAPPFRGRVPVFVGDDLTDEDGFALVRDRGGLAVLVGARRPTLATHALRDPAAVRAWLYEAAAHVPAPTAEVAG
ncbi:trehalose-phosphatase [Tolypothrix campylonemoides VB511288]|nr:trehalose-phosphatase [Tolypothrix campylonemoides VB511288]